MTNDEMIHVFDHRLMDLLADYYDPYVPARYKAVCANRMFENIHIAEQLGVITFEDYDHIMCILQFIGTDFTMEERLW